MQRRAAHAQIGHRLPARLTLGKHLDIGAHQAQDLDDPGPRGIPADMLQHQIGIRRDRGANQEKRRRGDIGRYIDRACLEATTALDTAREPRAGHGPAEASEHAFRVVAALCGLLHAGSAIGVQPGEQDRGFHLRAGHRRHVFNAVQGLPAVDHERRRAALRGLDQRTHTAERLGHTAHRPPGERCVAGQGGVEGLCGQQTGQ